MLEKAERPRSPYRFDPWHVNDACAFIEDLPHVKARDGTIVLEPVQCWWLAAIFGFRDRANDLRWVRTVELWIPRKAGKTTLAVGIILYCMGYEGEVGAETVISAGSEDQANVPFSAIAKTFEAAVDLKEHFRAHVTKDYADLRAVGGMIRKVSSRAKNLDGLNPHVVLAEELHAQNQDVIGVLKTAMGSRLAPLWLSISTAGRQAFGPAYESFRECQAILEGRRSADRLFAAVYTADDGDSDKRFDLRVIEKINPLWGVTLYPASIDEERREARISPSKLQEYLRTRLNIWSRAAGNLISVEAWDRCADSALSLDMFKGFPMYVGIDLASRSDLNAAAFMIKAGEKVYVKVLYWICEQSQRMTDDRYADDFAAWARNCWLRLTPGGFIDYRVILKDIFEMVQGHDVVAVGLDDYQANLMSGEIGSAGYETFMLRKVARQITPATDDFLARIDAGLLAHDGSPVSAWCAGNVVGHWDANDNVLPKKEKRGSKENIDGIDAAIIANALRLADESGTLHEMRENDVPNPYMERGLAGSDV
ncbi:terminase large subunit [Pseudochelatococcus sp. B33]